MPRVVIVFVVFGVSACAPSAEPFVPQLRFSSPGISSSFELVVSSAAVEGEKAVIAFESRFTGEEPLTFDLVDDAPPLLPAPGEVLQVVGSVSEFEELPEATYFRFHLAGGPSFLEGGFARRDGEEPLTGEDIDSVFRVGEVHDPWTGAATALVLLDDGPIPLKAGEHVAGTIDGVAVRAALTAARHVTTCAHVFTDCITTDTLDGYAYVVTTGAGTP